MNILLYLQSEIVKFKLPTDISGSFSFDWSNVDSKLINIDAVEGKWILHQTEDVKINVNGAYVDKVELLPNNFYILVRDNVNYLIYTSNRVFNSVLKLNYAFKTDLTISNNGNASIRYTCPYLKELSVTISKNGNKYVVKHGNTPVYINKNLMVTQESEMNSGDTIEIYGLRISIINDLVLISGNINNVSYGIIELNDYLFPTPNPVQKIEIKDIDLYKKEDYFNKSPRLRRKIEVSKVRFDKPPTGGTAEDLPLILTLGPMITMGATSGLTLLNIMTQITRGTIKFSDSWPQLLTSLIMIISMVFWPMLMNYYNRKLKEKKKKQLTQKYNKYLSQKQEEIEDLAKLQSTILLENLITVEECVKNIQTKGIEFWSKRLDQNDVLVARLGLGREQLHAEIQYPEEGFTIEENELKKKADDMLLSHQYLDQVPIGYSFNNNILTSIMGDHKNAMNFINSVILQLISFYTYDDLKIVVFTNEINEQHFEYLKYINHTFNNSKSFRFFATSNEDTKRVSDVLSSIAMQRLQIAESGGNITKPHYFIIVDDYAKLKYYDLINIISEANINIGFNVVFLENSLGELPSKCDNFINIGPNKSNVLLNAFEDQRQNDFMNEDHPTLDMMSVARNLANIPVELESESRELPNSITFLEMEEIGKVEQLNILSRWRSNDPTRTLRAEIGVDSQGNLMYLDLHEKAHGPHGLIAGMTGSGKSEFIITYILSMAINYSPDEVSFILIDYKGGGLAGAFENRATGMVLPHLAGTITNLDKAEMDRTLVSINSELERRQKLFNQERDALGESTIDIYKYQSLYREGKIKTPIPHLFIICDEFAELKSQQPDFMDSLISTARIGRSLGVHLILATQKPSGVVNDQIWSNTKFRVCLKVQDASDSREMLKKTDAAEIKQTGRFYLQVGYDEYYALGQSAWCGAAYYPSDKIIKQVDNSINFIDNCGDVIKSIQEGNRNKVSAEGEQITAILKHIIDVANQENVRSRTLWLPSISDTITLDYVTSKYRMDVNNGIFCLLGEYDAPEMQKQGPVVYNYLEDGNTIIYGNDGESRELLLNTLIYQTSLNYSARIINYYIVDYGSESVRKFSSLPQVGGMVFSGEDEKLTNLLKLLKEEVSNRKKLFVNYGGEYINYIKGGNELPVITVILNNFDSIYDSNQHLYDELPELMRDSTRYGIVFIVTGNATNSVPAKFSQNFTNFYAFRLKDISDYTQVFNVRLKNAPKEFAGRGIFKEDNVLHEFQVASIVDETVDENEYISKFIEAQKNVNQTHAKKIPVLPDIVRMDDINEVQISLNNLPIGISKKNLDVITVDYTLSIGNIIASNRAINTIKFVKSLIQEMKNISKFALMIFDPASALELDKNVYQNYYTDTKNVIDTIINYIKKQKEINADVTGAIVIYGLQKFVNEITTEKMKDLVDAIKSYEKMTLVVIDDVNKLKGFNFEPWWNGTFNLNDGIWIGKGFGDQSFLHSSTINKEMLQDYKNDMGYVLTEGSAELTKFIDFISKDGDTYEE
ncbi:MAG: type VII secretion protein EssC [Bacilli bacterium]|nr:type VII secretion protein EssC [Bacilli bacterium]